MIANLYDGERPLSLYCKGSTDKRRLADTERNHFQLLRIGWRKNRFVHACPFHFDIKDGKIWIQQNRTDVEVDKALMEMGVPKSDIVIGFLPVEMRAASGYAVA